MVAKSHVEKLGVMAKVLTSDRQPARQTARQGILWEPSYRKRREAKSESRAAVGPAEGSCSSSSVSLLFSFMLLLQDRGTNCVTRPHLV